MKLGKMIAKVFIFALLSTSLTLADVIVNQTQLEQKFLKKVDELLVKFDEKVVKCTNKDEAKLGSVLSQLKLKNADVAAVTEAKWTELVQDLEEIKTKVKGSIEEKKTSVLNEIKNLGKVAQTKYSEVYAKGKQILDEEKAKFEIDLETWHQKAKDLKEEAKRDVKKIELEELLNHFQKKFGAIYEAKKERLNELKKKYLELRQECKKAVGEKKLQYQKELSALKDQPAKYVELKTQSKKEISALKAKYSAEEEHIQWEFREIIQNMQNQLSQN